MSEAGGTAALRLAAFTALSAFAAAHWAALVVDPPVDRALLCVLTVAAGAGALMLVGRAPLPQPRRFLLSALFAIATVIVALLVIGTPARMLVPGNWGELGSAVRSGLEGIEDVDYPYAGDHPWSRFVILLALPVSLGGAAALAFWPARSRGPMLRALALAIVVGVYATAVITDSASHPLLRGLVLLALLAAWLWLPNLGRRQALAFCALVAASGAIAVPLASALDAERPWLDYRDWSIDFSGGGGSESFDWDHSYGPLDWPRTGKKLLVVRSETPHYWKATVLDSFDGFRWRTSPGPPGLPAELPSQLAGRGAVWKGLNRKWIDWIRFDVESLRSGLVLSAGAVQAVRGLDVTIGTAGLTLRDGLLEEADSYALRTYAPDPSAEQMRQARGGYAPALARFTTIQLPSRDPDGSPGTGESVGMPFWGDPGSTDASRRLAKSPYAPVYGLARIWSAGAPTALDAVQAIQDRLRDYAYSEDPPDRRYPLRAFLLADRVGYCQQFSGAMALMLRMIGIPSRVAAGFSPGERDEDRFVVRDYDAHSWVEVYFNGIGWVPFDPTPGVAPAQSQTIGIPLRPALPGGVASPQGGAAAAKPSAGRRAGGDSGEGMPLWWVPLGIVVVLFAAGLPLARRRRRCRALSAAALAEAQLRELEAALRRLGRPIAGGTTLRDLERRLASRRRSGAATYVSKLREVRYQQAGAGPPSLRERSRLRRELRSGDGAGARLRSLLAFPPGGPALPIRPR